MKIIGISAVLVLSISYLIIIFTAIYTGKAIKRLILNAIFGLAILGLMDITAKFSGVYIPINIYTVLGAAGFGVPSIICFLLLPLII